MGRSISVQSLNNIKELYNIKDSWHLSGGEKQRIALARMLDPKNKLILLDESFSNLDLNSAKEILNKMLKELETVIIVSHRSEEINIEGFESLNLN